MNKKRINYLHTFFQVKNPKPREFCLFNLLNRGIGNRGWIGGFTHGIELYLMLDKGSIMYNVYLLDKDCICIMYINLIVLYIYWIRVEDIYWIRVEYIYWIRVVYIYSIRVEVIYWIRIAYIYWIRIEYIYWIRVVYMYWIRVEYIYWMRVVYIYWIRVVYIYWIRVV